MTVPVILVNSHVSDLDSRMQMGSVEYSLFELFFWMHINEGIYSHANNKVQEKN